MFPIQHKQCDRSARVQHAERLRCIIEKGIPISGKYIWHYFFFWINLLNVFANIPNEGSFKCFTMQFLTLVSLQWKNESNMDWKDGHYVCERTISFQRSHRGTLVPLSNMQNLSCWGLFFIGYFSIFWFHMKLQSYFHDYIILQCF